MYPAKPDKVFPILSGGLFLGILSAVPPISYLNCACCVLVIGGGFLTSYLYMKDYPPEQLRVTYGDGALLGLLAGLLGAVVDTIISIPVDFFFGEFRNQEALESLRSAPEIPTHVVDFLTKLMVGGITVVGLLFTLVSGAIIFSLFSMIGGVLGVAILGPKGSVILDTARQTSNIGQFQSTSPNSTPEPPNSSNSSSESESEREGSDP